MQCYLFLPQSVSFFCMFIFWHCREIDRKKEIDGNDTKKDNWEYMICHTVHTVHRNCRKRTYRLIAEINSILITFNYVHISFFHGFHYAHNHSVEKMSFCPGSFCLDVPLIRPHFVQMPFYIQTFLCPPFLILFVFYSV